MKRCVRDKRPMTKKKVLRKKLTVEDKNFDKKRKWSDRGRIMGTKCWDNNIIT
jgi:hypothetical protein